VKSHRNSNNYYSVIIIMMNFFFFFFFTLSLLESGYIDTERQVLLQINSH